jgi:hypothetical protein
MREGKRAGIIATLTEMTSELIDVDLAPLRRAPEWLRNWGSFHHSRQFSVNERVGRRTAYSAAIFSIADCVRVSRLRR